MNTNKYIPYNLTELTDNSLNLIITNGLFNGYGINSINITNNGNLKRIEIGNNTYVGVRVFNLDGLNELESVLIGNGKDPLTYGEFTKRDDGLYRVMTCPKLKSIKIGALSYYNYKYFELNNLPSLQSIDIGNRCFCWAPIFSLTSMNEGVS